MQFFLGESFKDEEKVSVDTQEQLSMNDVAQAAGVLCVSVAAVGVV